MLKYWIIDSFTNEAFTGNPAAVIFVQHFPTDALMLKIAIEFNLSETAFVKISKNKQYHIRWFTPSHEVKLCGHATLASAFALWETLTDSTSEIRFNSLSGVLSITREQQLMHMSLPRHSVKAFVPNKALQQFIKQTPINAAASSDQIILEFSSAKIVEQLSPNFNLKEQLSPTQGIIATAKSAKKYDYVIRYFAPQFGVDEDPVTGSAQSALAPYWADKLERNTFHVYQCSKRGGEFSVKLSQTRVILTGQATMVMQGRLVAL